jgi:hypothetical protein
MAFYYSNEVSINGQAFPVGEVTCEFTAHISDVQTLIASYKYQTDADKAKAELQDPAKRARMIRIAVGAFASEDLGLLYKVLDDPPAFGIHKIKAGAYLSSEIDIYEGGNKAACIVGALAIAKLGRNPKAVLVGQIATDLATDLTNATHIPLGILDVIINGGYLDEFKTEIQRQMLER